MPREGRPLAFPTVGPAVHRRACRIVGVPLEDSFREWIGRLFEAHPERVDAVIADGVRFGALEPVEPGRPLTHRQREVLALVAGGCTYARAARSLGLSPWTVRSLARDAIGRLHAEHVTHAVVLALRSGQLELEGVAA